MRISTSSVLGGLLLNLRKQQPPIQHSNTTAASPAALLALMQQIDALPSNAITEQQKSDYDRQLRGLIRQMGNSRYIGFLTTNRNNRLAERVHHKLNYKFIGSIPTPNTLPIIAVNHYEELDRETGRKIQKTLLVAKTQQGIREVMNYE